MATPPNRRPGTFQSAAEWINRVLHMKVLAVDPADEEAGLAGEAPPAPSEPVDSPRPSHGPNFETVCWNGRRYNLTPKQRIVIAVLWKAWEEGDNPFIDGAYLLERAESDQKRLSHLFRGSDAWMSLIVPGEPQGGPIGTYCLCPAAKA